MSLESQDKSVKLTSFLVLYPKLRRRSRFYQPLCSAIAWVWAWSLLHAARKSKTWTSLLLSEGSRKYLSSSKSNLNGSAYACLRKLNNLGNLQVLICILRLGKYISCVKFLWLSVAEDKKHCLDCSENCGKGEDTGSIFKLTWLFSDSDVGAPPTAKVKVWMASVQGSFGFGWKELNTPQPADYSPDSKQAEDLTVCSPLLLHMFARDYSPHRSLWFNPAGS